MYLSDMTDGQWEIVQKHFPAGKRAGRPRGRSARDMINDQRSTPSSMCKLRVVSGLAAGGLLAYKRKDGTDVPSTRQ